MQRRKEVNVYEQRTQGSYISQGRTLCEDCRFALRGRFEVMEFGAESEQASLTCEECGYEMLNNDPADPRWQDPQTKTWWDSEATTRAIGCATPVRPCDA